MIDPEKPKSDSSEESGHLEEEEKDEEDKEPFLPTHIHGFIWHYHASEDPEEDEEA